MHAETGPSVLQRAVGGVVSAFCAVDDAFTWLAKHPSTAAKDLQAPPLAPLPRPESREYPLQSSALSKRPPRAAPRSLRWKELGELRAALSENESSLQRMSFELASRDVQAQSLVERAQEALLDRQAQLRQLREIVDSAPEARAARLSSLHARVHAAHAALEAAKAEVMVGRETAAERERVAWEGEEERAAALAAECAREAAEAEALEAETLRTIGRFAERIARAEEAVVVHGVDGVDSGGETTAQAPGSVVRSTPVSRRGLVSAEQTSRRVAFSRFTHERPARLHPRLLTMRAGVRMQLRGPLRHNAETAASAASTRAAPVASDAQRVVVRLGAEQPPWLHVEVAPSAGTLARTAPQQAPASLSTSLFAAPLATCTRLCFGPAESAAVPWAIVPLLQSFDARPPPCPPSRGSQALCMTLVFADSAAAGGSALKGSATVEDGPPSNGTAAGALSPVALHLVATSRADLEDCFLGVQALSALWPTDRLPPGKLRWRWLRLAYRELQEAITAA